MLKRVSSAFKDKKEKSPEANGANGTTAQIESANSPDSHSNAAGSLGAKLPENDPSNGPDHSVSREGIVASFEKFSQVIHAANRPLATDTGDGSYAEDSKPSGVLDDLKVLRVKDLETANTLLKQQLTGTELTDDKTMIMEKTIQLVSKLPENSLNRVKLTNTFVGTLWDSLGHPPPSQLGDKYNYRQADGSHNNIQFPHVGKAGTPYARTVPPLTVQPVPKPDPGLIFDTIMNRENGGFKAHPNNVSSMLYYMASIVIHDCFRTSHTDFNISETSSYLDLSPLYGSNLQEQTLMRTFEKGRLKPDCFGEKRLLGFPPGVGCILIMFNRFHNYVVEKLANINEGGRFKEPLDEPKTQKEKDVALKYDEDLFQTGRLVTCGLYINIILLDYLRTIVGLNRVNSTWTLDPRVATDHAEIPRGLGNQCSAEFNLVYRWHSCISERDEKWSQGLYKKLFHKDYKEVTLPELLAGLIKLEEMTPDDPLKRDFAELRRDADGKFDDDELVAILTSSIEDVAGASGANNVPEVLRAVEILGMEQARAWKCATLNEFRKFFGLIPHKTFEDINSDPVVSSKLKNLFDHPDFVELYPGLVCEDAKKPMDPGVGICPTYTISRSILSDAVTLVRGDRFYTIDYHPANLTNWGFSEVAYDLSINQGCVFYKLFIRAFPNHFKFNSIYAHYPLTIPSENKKIMKDLGRLDEFSWDKPIRVPLRINVNSYNGVKTILDNGEAFGVDQWRKGFKYLMGNPGADFMLSGDGPFYNNRRLQMKDCLYQANWHKNIKVFYETITTKLLKQWSFNIDGKTNQVDIIRDIGNSAHIYFAANIFHLPLKSDSNPKGVYTEHELYIIMALIFIVVFFGEVDPAKTFPLRAAGLPLLQGLGKLVETNVKIINETGMISGLIDPFFEEHNALKDYGIHMVRHLLKGELGVHETVWSQILPTAGAMVANQAQVFGQVIDFYLGPGKQHLSEINRIAKLNTDDADAVLLHYVMEAIRLNGTFGAYRTCHQDITIPDSTSPSGSGSRIFKPGDNVFVSFVDIAKDPNVYPDPEIVKLDRPLNSYIVYGSGPHECLGEEASKVALTAMLKIVGRLDNLRPAPGEQGQMKKIQRPGDFYVYMDALQSQEFPFPTTMKVRWDGEIEEVN